MYYIYIKPKNKSENMGGRFILLNEEKEEYAF